MRYEVCGRLFDNLKAAEIFEKRIMEQKQDEKKRINAIFKSCLREVEKYVESYGKYEINYKDSVIRFEKDFFLNKRRK